MQTFDLTHRPRRLRQKPALRALVRENQLTVNDLIYPLFIKEGLAEKNAINSMPDCFQYPLKDLANVAKEIETLGIKAVILFAIPKDKDEIGSAALKKENIITKSIDAIKAAAPNLLVITDLCFCEYTNHGHCGVLTTNHQLDNDKTLELLQQQAIIHADAGADIIAPSGMIDGMIGAIRHALDNHHHSQIPILSYAVKYQSALYGPFREAAEGAPQFGDRSSYQMDIANRLEALKEASLDIEQGADMLMVKPALFYLDIIRDIKNEFPQYPLCAYQVSGEYSMIVNAYQQGLVDKKLAILESLMAIKRAGSDMIISYFAKAAAKLL